MNTALKDFAKSALSLLPTVGEQFSVGLYVGHDLLNLVQLHKKAGQTCIGAMISMPYQGTRDALFQDPHQLKSFIKQAYAAQPFKGKRVVSCLPADQVKIMTITYSMAGGQSDAAAVAIELRERFGDELDKMVVDFMPLRQEDKSTSKREALVALATHENVEAYLDFLTRAGLKVDALDIGPAALTRLVVHTGALHTPDFPALPNVLLVNFGAGASYITIIWGRRLMLDREVAFSESRIFSKLNQVLDMPKELAMRLLYEKNTASSAIDETDQMVAEVLRPELAQLLDEVNKTLVYMASRTRGKSVDKVYLVGRVAHYPAIINYLREKLRITVDILDPIEVFSVEGLDNQALGTMSGVALTTGLALRGVSEHG